MAVPRWSLVRNVMATLPTDAARLDTASRTDAPAAADAPADAPADAGAEVARRRAEAEAPARSLAGAERAKRERAEARRREEEDAPAAPAAAPPPAALAAPAATATAAAGAPAALPRWSLVRNVMAAVPTDAARLDAASRTDAPAAADTAADAAADAGAEAAVGARAAQAPLAAPAPPLAAGVGPLPLVAAGGAEEPAFAKPCEDATGPAWSAEREAALLGIFRRCDHNHSGSIDKRELIKVCRQDGNVAAFFGIPSTIRQEDGSRGMLEHVFQGIDDNDDREISFEELRDWARGRCRNGAFAGAPCSAHGVAARSRGDPFVPPLALADDAAATEAEQARRRARRRKAQVAIFLRVNGFAKGVTGPKQTFVVYKFKTTYPLHAAAKSSNEMLVKLLLEEGADPAQVDSDGKTAAEVAQKANLQNSHSKVLRVLDTATPATQPAAGGA